MMKGLGLLSAGCVVAAPSPFAVCVGEHAGVDASVSSWEACIVQWEKEDGAPPPHINHVRMVVEFFAKHGLPEPRSGIAQETVAHLKQQLPPQMANVTKDIIIRALDKLKHFNGKSIDESVAASLVAASKVLKDIDADVGIIISSDDDADCVVDCVSDGDGCGLEVAGDWADAALAPGVVSGGVLSIAAQKPLSGKKRRRGKDVNQGAVCGQPSSGKKTNKEASFALKIAAIQEAKVKFQLDLDEAGGFIMSKENRFQKVHLVSLGGQQKRLDHISTWSERMHKEKWQDMARNADLLEKYGVDPLSKMQRVPGWWMRMVAEGLVSEGMAAPGRPEFIDVESSCDEEPLEAFLANAKRDNVTKRRKLHNFPGLEAVIRQFSSHHERVRELDEPCDFDDLHTTFLDLLQEERRKQSATGLRPTVPETVSRGWFSDMKVRIGIKDSAVGSTEMKRLTLDDDALFWKGYAEKAKKHNISITNIITFDEFNDFMSKAPKRVQTSARERKLITGKRVKNTLKARITLTACVVFSPLMKGKVLLFMKQCNKTIAKHIMDDFGEDLILVVGEGKIVNGTTHVKHVLRRLLKDFIKTNKQQLKLGDDEWHMFLQDQAPGHTGDACKVTGEIGLKATRREFYQQEKVANHLYGLNGTPEQCVNDQVHKLIVCDLQEAVRDVIGRGKLLHKRPQTQRELRHGGQYYTEAGNRRGASQYHYALAVATAWRAFPQIVLTAAFVRLRFLSKAMAARMLQVHEDEVTKGLVSLEQWQDMVKKKHMWLHQDQDFSGTPAPVQEPGVAVVEAVAAAKSSLDTLKGSIVPATLSVLVGEGMVEADERFRGALTHKRERAGSALASLAVMPGPDNVGEYFFFRQAIRVPFSRSPYWNINKKLTKEVKEDILEWHYDYLKKKYLSLVDVQSPQVVRSFGGAERQVTLHVFIWDVLKAVHKKKPKDMDELVRRMVGDVKKYGLNPTLRHPKPKGAAAPPPVPAAAAAGPTPAPPIPAPAVAAAAAPAPPACPPAAAPAAPSHVSHKDFLVKALAAVKHSAKHGPKKKPLKLPKLAYKHFPKLESKPSKHDKSSGKSDKKSWK